MSDKKTKESRPSYTEFTLDMFSRSSGKNHSEIKQFNQWRDDIIEADKYTFETPHLTAQTPEITNAKAFTLRTGIPILVAAISLLPTA